MLIQHQSASELISINKHQSAPTISNVLMLLSIKQKTYVNGRAWMLKILKRGCLPAAVLQGAQRPFGVFLKIHPNFGPYAPLCFAGLFDFNLEIALYKGYLRILFKRWRKGGRQWWCYRTLNLKLYKKYKLEASKGHLPGVNLKFIDTSWILKGQRKLWFHDWVRECQKYKLEASFLEWI